MDTNLRSYGKIAVLQNYYIQHCNKVKTYQIICMYKFIISLVYNLKMPSLSIMQSLELV